MVKQATFILDQRVAHSVDSDHRATCSPPIWYVDGEETEWVEPSLRLSFERIFQGARTDLKHVTVNKEREGVSVMELRGDHLVLTSVTIEKAPVLLPAFNGDEQFNQWSGHASDLTLAQVHVDMLGTLNQHGGVVWRLADQTETLVGVAKTALLPSPGTAWIDLLVIRRAFQGRGYGSEAATLLETHFFSSPEIRQIALAVMIQNTPAIAFWEKRGYARGVRYLDNEGDDVYAYLLSRPTSTA